MTWPRYEELQGIVKNLKNHKNIQDITKVLTDFEDLTKSYEKAHKTMEADGVLKFYIRVIAELEDFTNTNWTNKKNLSKNNAKSLTALRQKIKKYNKDFEAQINDFREVCIYRFWRYWLIVYSIDNIDLLLSIIDLLLLIIDLLLTFPDFQNNESYPMDLIAEVEGRTWMCNNEFTIPSHIEEKIVEKKPEDVKKKDESDSDEDIWDKDSSSESESEEDEEETELYKNDPAARFLKSHTSKQKDKKKKDKREKDIKELKRKDKDDEDGWTTVDMYGRPEVKLFGDDEEITKESILNKLKSELAGRVTKKDMKKSQVDILQQLIDLVVNRGFGIGLHIKIMVSMVSLLLQYKCSASNPCMTLENWKKWVYFVVLLIFRYAQLRLGSDYGGFLWLIMDLDTLDTGNC